MAQPDLKVVWTNVDQTPGPFSFVRFLDAFNATDWLQAPKRGTLMLLDAHDGDHSLDVGCGAGVDAQTLAQKVGKTGQIAWVDPSAAMITEARQRADGLALPVE